MPVSDKRQSNWSLEHRLLFGQVSCLVFGMALILWGLAPTLMQRILTGEPPTIATIAANLLCFLLAVMFIGFHVLIKHRVRWAAWSAFLLSCIILGGGIAISFATGFQFHASFILVLSAVVCFGSWLAIEAIQKWPVEGPFARAVGEDADADSDPGTFVADGPVYTRPPARSPHDRMFADSNSTRDATPPAMPTSNTTQLEESTKP